MIKLVRLNSSELKRNLYSKARELMGLYKNTMGGLLCPINLEELAKLRLAEIVEKEKIDHFEAFVTPVRGGFCIRYSIEYSKERQRINIAHEIAHTLMYDLPEKKDEFPKNIFSSGSIRCNYFFFL